MKDETDKKLELRKIRPTAMRELVLTVFMETQSALSLTDLEMKFDYADKSTLFRTLKTFEEKKLIHRIDDGTGSIKYALCKDNCEIDHEDFHVHFLCNTCKQTFCLNDISIPAIKLPHGFKLHEVNTIVKGVCSNCEKKDKHE